MNRHTGALPLFARTPEGVLRQIGPRIVTIDAAFRENGGTRVLIDLSARWQAQGVQTEYFVLQKVAEEAEGLSSWAHAAVPVRYGADQPGRLRSDLPKIFWRLLASARRADVMVSVSEIGSGLLLGAAVAKLLRKRFVVVVHTPVTRAVARWTPKPLHEASYAALRSADLLICVARGCIDDLLKIGVDASRIRVVHNGLDVARVVRQGAAAIEPPLPSEVGRPLILAAGRLTEQKGFDLLLRAHAQVLQRGLAHHVAIAGEGPERAALEQLIQELGIAASVTLLGFRDNPHALMARADLFCMPSRYEGFPGVLIEALALGVPVLSANCVSGPSEILDDGAFGDLVEAESVEALADGLVRHLHAPERLMEIAKKGPERARSFDPDKAAAEYLALFSSLMDAD